MLSEGLSPELRTPRGATTTLAALLLDTAAGLAASGTVHATVGGLAGSSASMHVLVTDGTAATTVTTTGALSVYGPGRGSRYELDLDLPAGAAAHDPAARWPTREALGGPLGVITALRPLG